MPDDNSCGSYTGPLVFDEFAIDPKELEAYLAITPNKPPLSARQKKKTQRLLAKETEEEATTFG